MKIPHSTLDKMSTSELSFSTYEYKKISSNTFMVFIPCYYPIPSEVYGTIHIVKLKTSIYIYFESEKKINQDIIQAMHLLKEHVMLQKDISKKVNKKKLEIEIIEKPVNFKKLKRKKTLLGLTKLIGLMISLFSVFLGITLYSIQAENAVQGTCTFISLTLSLLSIYALYRSSNTVTRVDFKKSFNIFIILSSLTCLSFLSFLFI